jgi:hypothetical protein
MIAEGIFLGMAGITLYELIKGIVSPVKQQKQEEVQPIKEIDFTF